MRKGQVIYGIRQLPRVHGIIMFETGHRQHREYGENRLPMLLPELAYKAIIYQLWRGGKRILLFDG